MSAGRQQAMIDQATGWLAARLDCAITEAGGHLAALARETGVSLAEAAALLLRDGPSAVPPQPEPRPAELPPSEPQSATLAEARARIERERREETLRMQRAILPTPDYQFRYGRYDIAVRYQPAESGDRVGGDWYEARARSDGTALVTIGDVAGHGLSAAGGMARIGNALRGMTVTGQPPEILLHWLNDLVCADEVPELVASAAVAALDQDVPRMRWAQAGHPPPVLIRDGRSWLLPRPAGMLLGTLPGAEYDLATEDLAPGDRVVFYTDGVVERRDRDIDVGMAELARAAMSCPGVTAIECAAELADRLSPSGEDDVSVLVIHVMA